MVLLALDVIVVHHILMTPNFAMKVFELVIQLILRVNPN